MKVSIDRDVIRMLGMAKEGSSKWHEAWGKINEAMEAAAPQPATPAHRWTEDPHAGQYDGERASLALGHLTDDELANGVFLHGDGVLDIERMIRKDPAYHSPIAWRTAAKERIRWLSRKLEQALSARTAGTPLLDSVVRMIDRYREDPATGDLDHLLASIHHVATHPIPDGLEVRSEGEANFYTILNEGGWVARVQMNGEMMPLRQEALLHAVCSSWKNRPPVVLPPRMTEDREDQELTGRFGVYGRVPAGVATQIYNAALDHVSETNDKVTEGVKVVADVSGGAIHAVYAEVPVEVLFISDDLDDIHAQEEGLEDGEDLLVDEDRNAVASWRQTSDGGQDSEFIHHFFDQLQGR